LSKRQAGSQVQVIVDQGKTANAIVRSITRQADLASPHPAMPTNAGGRLAILAQENEKAVKLVTPHLRLEAMIADPDNSLRTGQSVKMIAATKMSI